MTNEDLWMKHYDECCHFILRNRRLPSKYRPEERNMVNWMKYNRKCVNRNKMVKAYAEKYERLLELCNKYRRINQYAYLKATEKDLNFE